MSRKKKETIVEVVETIEAVEVKERKQASAQELIRRMLVDSFLFQPVSKRATSFGERILLRSPEANVEAHLGVYRVCFYLIETAGGEEAESNKLPKKNAPRCFGTEQRGSVREFLERIVGKPLGKKARSRINQIELFPANDKAA
jgi:hypothetical protein